MLESVIRDWAKDNKNLLIIYTINILFGVIAGYYLVPSISSKVIDSISKTGTIEMMLMVSLFGAYIFISCADLLKRWLEDSFVPDFNMNIRNEIFRYVISSYNKGKDIEIGKLLNVMSYLPSSIRNIMLDVLRVFLPLTIAIVVMIVYFFNLNNNIAYVQIGTLAILLLNLYFYAKRLIKEADDSMDDYLKISEKSKDRISNLGSIFTSNQEKYEVNRYKNINRKNIEIYRN